MRESKKQKAERIRAALAALKEAYPDAKPELNFTSPFELLVATQPCCFRFTIRQRRSHL